MKTFTRKPPNVVAIETASPAQKAASAGRSVHEKKLTIDISVALHAAMKRSCQRRGIAIAKEVPQVLEAAYRGGPSVAPAPVARHEFEASLVAEAAAEKKDKMVRVSLIIPADLHAAIIDQATARHNKMTDEVRALLAAQYVPRLHSG